jgi:hypothetical protein
LDTNPLRKYIKYKILALAMKEIIFIVSFKHIKLHGKFYFYF